MKSSKKKIYLIIYSIMQLIAGVVSILKYETLAKSLSVAFEQVFEAYPKEIVDIMMAKFTPAFLQGIVITMGVSVIIFSLAFLILILTNKIAKNKTFAIIILVVLILASVFDLMLIFTGIAIYVVVSLDSEKSIESKTDEKKEIAHKEKKELKLELLKANSKEKLLVVVLIIAYCIQFFFPVTNSFAVAVGYEIVFRFGILALVFYVFAKNYKRDTKHFLKNKKAHLLTALKYWGIMLLGMFIVNLIKILLSFDDVSQNQTSLMNLPIWYVAPLAIIWAPIVEEAIFRFGIRRFINNDKLFIVVSGILFGLLHTLGQETGVVALIVQTIPYAVMGGVLAYSYTKTNNVWTSSLVHCYQNTFSTVMMFLLSLMA